MRAVTASRYRTQYPCIESIRGHDCLQAGFRIGWCMQTLQKMKLLGMEF